MKGSNAVKSIRTTCAWPLSRLGEAIAALGARAGLPVQEAATAYPPADVSPRKLEAWIEAVAEWVGLETEHSEIPYTALGRHLSEAAPALVRIPAPAEPQFLAPVSG